MRIFGVVARRFVVVDSVEEAPFCVNSSSRVSLLVLSMHLRRTTASFAAVVRKRQPEVVQPMSSAAVQGAQR